MVGVKGRRLAGSANQAVFAKRNEDDALKEWFNFVPRGVIVGICLNHYLSCLFHFVYIPEKVSEGLNCLIQAVQVFSREGHPQAQHKLNRILQGLLFVCEDFSDSPSRKVTPRDSNRSSRIKFAPPS
jgi:hypothetical protein